MKLLIIILIVSVGNAVAGGFSSLAQDVFSGAKKYSVEDAKDLLANDAISQHHRYITSIQMLSGVDEIERFQQAIQLTEEYERIGRVQWAKKFVRVQKAFLLNLSSSREQGAVLMEQLLNEEGAIDFNGEQDQLFKIISQHTPDNSNRIHDLLRQSLGFYYLNAFPENEKYQEISLNHFNKIKLKGLKDKNLKQFKFRTGLTLKEDAKVNENFDRGSHSTTRKSKSSIKSRSASKNNNSNSADMIIDDDKKNKQEPVLKWSIIAALVFMLVAFSIWIKPRKK